MDQRWCTWIGTWLLMLQAVSPAAEVAPRSVSDLVMKVKPSIVVITFTGRDNDRAGLGSGFIIHPDGLIATNLHVIGEARPIAVQLQDGRKFDVTAIEAHERQHDLAILRIAAKGLPALPLGNSDDLADGTAIMTIGNPLGLDRSVVTGVLSGHREVEGRPMLQIAMPIERGNSGGPILDLDGRVQGIVTLKSLKTENLGFAVPVNLLKPLIEKPNPITMDRWLTIGVVDPSEWTTLPGGRWRQRAGRMLVEGRGGGLGGRCVCFAVNEPPAAPYEVGVLVKFKPWDGAAGLVFAADGGDRHYGFYPSNGELRLSRFDGPDVYAWNVLAQVRSPHLRKDDWNALKVRVEADRIRCYVNDVLVIESQDKELRGGKVGLCKFRQTEAEFKDFRVGTELPPTQPPADALARITAATVDLPLTGEPSRTTIEAAEAVGQSATAVLEARARMLELQADRLRHMSGLIHQRRVLQELKRICDRPEVEVDLLRGGLWIAAADNPELVVDDYVLEVDRIARRIRQRIPDQASDAEKLAALKRDLFEEQGFHGSRHDYDHRSNSYLNEVLDDREGLPITLSVVVLEVARRLDLPMAGIGLPRHFVVRHLPQDKPAGVLLDPFERGKELSVDDAKAKVAALGETEWNDSYLAPTPKKSILVRMLRNLFGNARDAEDSERMLRYTDLVLAITPDSAQDRFYRAALCLQLQRLDEARREAEWLQEKQPEGLSPEAIEDLNRAIAREAARAPRE